MNWIQILVNILGAILTTAATAEIPLPEKYVWIRTTIVATGTIIAGLFQTPPHKTDFHLAKR